MDCRHTHRDPVHGGYVADFVVPVQCLLGQAQGDADRLLVGVIIAGPVRQEVVDMIHSWDDYSQTGGVAREIERRILEYLRFGRVAARTGKPDDQHSDKEDRQMWRWVGRCPGGGKVHGG